MLKLENLAVLVLFIIRSVMMPKKPLTLWMVWSFQIMVKRFKLDLLNPIGEIGIGGVGVEVEAAMEDHLGDEDHHLHGPEVHLDTVGVVHHHLGNEDRHPLGPEVHHHLGNEITAVMDPGVVEGAAEDDEDLMVVAVGVDVDVVGEVMVVVEMVLLVDLMCINN